VLTTQPLKMCDVRNIFINEFNYIDVAGKCVAIAVALAGWQQRAQLPIQTGINRTAYVIAQRCS
jgi:hypothetical protein